MSAKKSNAAPFGRFFLPGPTEVRPAVLEAMLQPMIGHRVPAMEDLMGHIQPRIRQLFRTERPVYIFPASGTGAMEAGLRNGARRRVLSLVNGAFSERFYRIALATGLKADALEVEWGQAHTADMLDGALKRGIYDAVTVCHSETSTGVLNPIDELAEVTRAAGDVALLVDSVSGMAGAPVETDAWGLDWVLTGSQKAMALPPGLAFGVAQEGLLERARNKADRGIYFDFLEYEKNLLKNQTPNTPAVSLMFALAVQLDAMMEEGVERRWERHAAMARRTWAWVDELAGKGAKLEIMAPEGARSPTVSAIRPPAGWTGPKVVAAAQERGFAVATGYGRLREETFRIGHMGDHTVNGLEALLEALTEVFTA
ncbi:MAG: alanine--glyoxylate aminotransferase family protein [Gemmatimonadota bacterium]